MTESTPTDPTTKGMLTTMVLGLHADKEERRRFRIDTTGWQIYAKNMEPYGERQNLNIVGGCCGTFPSHIAKLKEVLGKCWGDKGRIRRGILEKKKTFKMNPMRLTIKSGFLERV